MKTRTLAIAALLGSFAVGGMATAAHADETPATKSVAWVVTSGDFSNRFGTPQTLFAGEVGACGQPLLQIDLYRYDTPEHIATVDALTSKGTLSSAAEDGTVWISNVDLPSTEPCQPTPTPVPTTTPEPTAPPVTPAPTGTPAAEPSPPVSEPVSVPTEAPTPTAEPAAQPTATATTAARIGGSTPEAAPTADELAFTGSESKAPWIAAGLAAVGLGVAGILYRRRMTNSEAE